MEPSADRGEPKQRGVMASWSAPRPPRWSTSAFVVGVLLRPGLIPALEGAARQPLPPPEPPSSTEALPGNQGRTEGWH